MSDKHTYRDLVFVGVSGEHQQIVTFGARSARDPARTNLVSYSTATGATHCDCKAAMCGRPCWHAELAEAAWLSHPAMQEVRWLTDARLLRYGRKLAAMTAIYEARAGRPLRADTVNLAAARSEWRRRQWQAAASDIAA